MTNKELCWGFLEKEKEAYALEQHMLTREFGGMNMLDDPNSTWRNLGQTVATDVEGGTASVTWKQTK